jgi:hypothetical protein
MPRSRRRGNPMIRIGTFLIIIGFGSAVLGSSSDYEFELLAWADGMQPFVGILVGLIGVGLLVAPFILRARQGSASSPIAPGAAFNAAPAPGGFPQPQAGPAGFAPPQAGPGGFPQPAAWEQQASFGQPPAAPQFGQQPQLPQNQPNAGTGWPQQ